MVESLDSAFLLQLLEQLTAAVGGRVIDDDHFQLEAGLSRVNAAHNLGECGALVVAGNQDREFRIGGGLYRSPLVRTRVPAFRHHFPRPAIEGGRNHAAFLEQVDKACGTWISDTEAPLQQGHGDPSRFLGDGDGALV